MQPVEIKSGIYWVGIVDWNLRDFHGYAQTQHGTTYNAYLVIDDKVTLFDTVEQKYREDFLCQISQIIDPEKIDYIVVNHTEPDHGSSLPFVVDRTNPEKILTSKMGKEFMLGRYHPENWPIETVENGQSISLGNHTVTFMETRMLHWPDSMVSYIPEEKLLISQDAFGQNIASSERFDDRISWEELKQEMANYFANIILPYSPKVKKTLDQIQNAGLEIDTIAPDHGLILRRNIQNAVGAYYEFAEQKPSEKAVIFYDTMWETTRKMAEAIGSGLSREGISVKIYSLKKWHHSDVMSQIWDAGAIIAGSPTHNNGIMPLVADMLVYMKGLRPKNKLGFSFGSYGWSGEAHKHISNWLQDMGIELVDDPYGVKHVPTHEQYQELAQKGTKIALAIKQKVKDS
ncbi:MAG: FprA family A-type flavoprotein [Thermodesulfobacteriota bacterium]